MTNMRASSADEAHPPGAREGSQLGAGHRVYPPRMNVEVTPKSLRLRKKILQQNNGPRPGKERRVNAIDPVSVLRGSA